MTEAQVQALSDQELKSRCRALNAYTDDLVLHRRPATPLKVILDKIHRLLRAVGLVYRDDDRYWPAPAELSA
jgi:hypothetical protein